MIVRILRYMAWERLKGELRSLSQTYQEPNEEGEREILEKAVEKFIKDIDDGGKVD